MSEPRTHQLANLARKFWGLSAWLLELIVVLSFILHKNADLAVALGLLILNAGLSFVQEQRASAAVAALRRELQIAARVVRDGRWQTVAARELVRGDVVRVRAGDFVPADLQLIEGELRIDQSALTGESQELPRAADDRVFSGSVVRRGEATAVVTATGVATFFGRTTRLVQTARPRLHVEEVVARVVKWLFLIVGVQVAAVLIVSAVRGLPLLDILPLALVVLMSAVPVALPVMFTVSMALGARELARQGVLVTRLSAAEDAASMSVLCADKTGTLTWNRLAVTGTRPEAGYSAGDVVTTGALASHEADRDPIDLAFLRAAQDQGLLPANPQRISFTPFTPATRRTEAVVEIGGRTTRVMKGALRTVAAVAGMEPAAIDGLEARAAAEAAQGVRILAVARRDADGDASWHLVGLALLRDAPRSDSRQLIVALQGLGVTVKMLTGDALPVARAMAHELGLGDVVRAPDMRVALQAADGTDSDPVLAAGGYAEVLPEDKYLVVQRLQALGRVVGMTGDGVNDAPALRQAEVGIAVSGATDVAKGAASVVLTREGLASVVDLVRGGRAIYQRVLTWIINKVSRTILKSGVVVIAFLVTGKFVISALGMVLVVFMTDFVKIALATDRVRPSPLPETWNIGPLVRIAVVLGLLMLVEALGVLALGWHRYHLGHDDGALATFTFLTLLFFALFSIVSIRERRAFWASWPSKTLAAALVADGLAGLLIGRYGVADLRPLRIGPQALIIGCAVACSLGLNDVVKVLLFRRRLSAAAPFATARTAA